jgi:AcrR family transcriptional regulator
MSPKVTVAHEQGQRARILGAAVSCFARAGVRRTTIQDICDEAGLSKGGLYTYFKAKDEIMAAVLERSFELSLDRARAAAAGGTGPLERLERVAEAFTEALLSGEVAPGHSSRLLLEIWAEAGKGDRIRTLCARGYARWREFLAGLLREAQAAGQLRRDIDPDALAAIFVSVFDGLGLQEAITRFRPDWRTIVQTLRTAIGEGAFVPQVRGGGAG